jgi:hypothetical protein
MVTGTNVRAHPVGPRRRRNALLVVLGLIAIWWSYRSPSVRAVLTTAETSDDSAAADACVYLLTPRGDRFALPYSGHTCSRPGYSAFPKDLDGNLASWTTNAHAAGILSAFDAFRLRARLATHDNTRKPFRFFSAHGGFNLAQFYGWADHVQNLAFTVAEWPDRLQPAASFFDRRLARAGLGAKRADGVMAVRQIGLSSRAQRSLVGVLAGTEARIGADSLIRAPKTPFDDAVRAVPGHETGRRNNFGQFTIQ